jgi:transposase-like protein
MSILSKNYFRSEKAAFKHLEALLWPNGPVCPHCGSMAQPYDLAKTRIGLRKCREKECRKQFTVRVGTVFESSHIPLHKWMQAAFLLCSSKKGMSAHQLHRTLEVTYKTAWFMAHRLREAMKSGGLPPMGGEGETVQMDETYFGTIDALRGKSWAEKKGHSKKMSVVTLVNKGKSRTFHVETANAETVLKILRENVKKETVLHTDESRIYKRAAKEFTHETVHHAAGEYVRGDVHINTAENYFSIFKRGMRGVYQHCSEKHLQRYLDEFDFRYNGRDIEDVERANLALKGASGKRLTYNPIA